MDNKKIFGLIILAFSAFLAGTVNALIGAGGGVILVFAIEWFSKKKEIRNSLALTNLAIILFSCISIGSYLKNDLFEIKSILPYILPAIIGGSCGALLLGKFKTRFLKLLFASVMFYSGVRMLV